MNITVKPEVETGHALSSFISINRFLTHGDDPYNCFFKYSTEIQNEELMISQSKFNEWFTSNPNPDDNIGRQTREVAMQYLPNYLLEKHYIDLAAGLNHSNSQVAESFSKNYTVAQLEARKSLATNE